MTSWTTKLTRKMAVFAIAGSGMVFGHGGCSGGIVDILDEVEDIVDEFGDYGGGYYHDDYYYDDYYYEEEFFSLGYF